MPKEDMIIGILTAAVCLLIGVFCIFCSAKNYDWFFNNRKAVPLVKMFGRKGARIFYICLGGFICLMAVLGLIGAVIS